LATVTVQRLGRTVGTGDDRDVQDRNIPVSYVSVPNKSPIMTPSYCGQETPLSDGCLPSWLLTTSGRWSELLQTCTGAQSSCKYAGTMSDSDTRRHIMVLKMTRSRSTCSLAMRQPNNIKVEVEMT